MLSMRKVDRPTFEWRWPRFWFWIAVTAFLIAMASHQTGRWLGMLVLLPVMAMIAEHRRVVRFEDFLMDNWTDRCLDPKTMLLTYRQWTHGSLDNAGVYCLQALPHDPTYDQSFSLHFSPKRFYVFATFPTVTDRVLFQLGDTTS